MPIPPSLLANLSVQYPPKSVLRVYHYLYAHSHYRPDPGYRRVECRIRDITRGLHLSDRTVTYALHFLRQHHYARCIWRGRPHPQDDRYNHSCYELPYDMAHVTAWRIQHLEKNQPSANTPPPLENPPHTPF